MGVANLSEYRARKAHAEKPEATGKGFALVYRKIQETEFYRKDSQAVHLWLHLILSVNHAPETVTTDYGDVVVERGQWITGAPTLEKETGIELERVKYLLKKFKRLGMITTFSPGKFTLITIVKYDDYQGDFTGKLFPQDSLTIPSPKSVVARLASEVVPQDSLTIPTNNNITNNSIPNGIESVTSGNPEKPVQAEPKQPKEKPAFTCEDVWQVLKDELPEARGWRMLSDVRRNSIRTFWKKATKITRELDGHPFTIQDFREYLQYIGTNCRWMLEDRPDNKSGHTWRRKKFDFFLDEKVYLEVREGDKDDIER